MSNIKTSRLPIPIQHYQDFIIESGGAFELNEENILSHEEYDGVITECLYFENDTELNWFSNDGIFYIFVDGVNICYFEQSTLHFI